MSTDFTTALKNLTDAHAQTEAERDQALAKVKRLERELEQARAALAEGTSTGGPKGIRAPWQCPHCGHDTRGDDERMLLCLCPTIECDRCGGTFDKKAVYVPNPARAYKAYCDANDGISSNGSQLKPWDEAGEAIQRGFKAVVRYCTVAPGQPQKEPETDGRPWGEGPLLG